MILFISVAIALVAGGIIFSILPPLPGPLLSYGALLTTHWSSVEASFSNITLIIWGVVVLLVLAADFIFPVFATKKFGGTKAGIRGGIIGTIGGVVLPIPFGIVIGPLAGAIIGDLYGGNHIKSAIKSGIGSFLGFLVATTLKLLVAVGIGTTVAIKIGVYIAGMIF